MKNYYQKNPPMLLCKSPYEVYARWLWQVIHFSEGISLHCSFTQIFFLNWTCTKGWWHMLKTEASAFEHFFLKCQCRSEVGVMMRWLLGWDYSVKAIAVFDSGWCCWAFEPCRGAGSFTAWSFGSNLAPGHSSVQFCYLARNQVQCACLWYPIQQLLCIPGKCSACAFQSGNLKRTGLLLAKFNIWDSLPARISM